MLILVLAATSEAEKTANAGGLSATLDVAALITAFIWPIFLLILFLIYREQLPTLFKGIASRLSKFEFAGVSIELAKAREFVPEWSEAVGALDLRHKAEAGQVNDSYMMTFRDQLLEEGNWDYAEVDLGSGNEWLTSRLFIMAVVFARMKGIKSLVFLKTSGTLRKRFVCWAEPQKVRWALAKRFPWLEQAYADAQSTVLTQGGAIIVSNEGRFGTSYNHADPEPSISLIREFLTRIQIYSAPAAPHVTSEWVYLTPSLAATTYERARWLSSLELEDILGPDCNKSTVMSSQLSTTNAGNQLRMFASIPGDFVAVVAPDQRFEYLVDRTVILEQVARQLAVQTE